MPEYRPRPYPDELIRAVRWLPAGQRRKMEEAYVVQTYLWQVTLQHTRPLRGVATRWARLALLDRGHEPWIYYQVDLEPYPHLDIAQQDQPLSIEGEIADVSGKEITLKDVVPHW